MSARARNQLVVALVIALVVALGGQALADAVVPEADASVTNRAVGRATLSYVTGLRTFAAAVLWVRMDPILHNYYDDVDLANQRYMLSTIAVVQVLDPHLSQPYYVGSWILVRNDRVDDAIEMAERGVAENPKAGILWVNLGQLRQFYRNDLPGAVEAAQQALADDMQWTDDVERHNAFPIMGAIFRKAGREDLDALVQAELDRIDAELGDTLAPEDHDHDGDGVPDH
jgi:tetratricopeptide (TPR) repeat protein